MVVSSAGLFTATLAATGLAAALPSKIGTVNNLNEARNGRVTLKQVRKPNFRFSGAFSVYKTYLKYGVQPPAALIETVVNRTGIAVDKRDTGSATNSPIDSFDDAYVTPVSIGTPAQVLNLDFDTGSSDFWVFSSETPSSEVDGQTIYKPGSSSTSEKLSGYTWEIRYGDNSTSSGDVYSDTVTIGGLTVTQAVESAKQVSSQFTDDASIDGLVGFGFDNINAVSPEQQATFFDNVLDQLDSPVFVADLKHNAAGTYDFGFIDSDKYTGSIAYVSVDSGNGYWEWVSSGYQVGSNSFKSKKIDGIADTGTTLLYLPTSVANAYWDQVSSSSISDSEGGYVFDCGDTLPSFTFGVGSARITIPGEYLDFGAVDESGSTCFGGLQDSTQLGINIFGDVALKAAYVVFENSDSPRLGWASKDL